MWGFIIIPPLLDRALISEMTKTRTPTTTIRSMILYLILPGLLSLFALAGSSCLVFADFSFLLWRALTEFSIGVFLMTDESRGDLCTSYRMTSIPLEVFWLKTASASA